MPLCHTRRGGGDIRFGGGINRMVILHIGTAHWAEMDLGGGNFGFGRESFKCGRE